MAKANDRRLDRRYTEGIAAMNVGLMAVIVGGQAIGLPAWSAWFLVPFGITAYIIGLRWYKSFR